MKYSHFKKTRDDKDNHTPAFLLKKLLGDSFFVPNDKKLFDRVKINVIKSRCGKCDHEVFILLQVGHSICTWCLECWHCATID